LIISLSGLRGGDAGERVLRGGDAGERVLRARDARVRVLRGEMLEREC
jgi:hypothetical protein